MTVFSIDIKTESRETKEKMYSLTETIERVAEIMDCDNIKMIDCVSMETGEIFLTVESGKVTYVAPDLPFVLISEN